MKVSIVTPSYNQGRFIARTLQSVAAQEVESLEHLVMDGGSSDQTVAVLRAAMPAVRWVSEPDSGQTDALNKGIRASTGEIIGWLNSDDVYYPGAIRRVLEVFEREPDVDIVYGNADHIDVDDRPIDPYPTEPWDPVRLLETCFICQPALFFRRRVVEQCGYPDVELHYCMDYEYWIRLARAGMRFRHVDARLAGSRMYGENKTLGARVAVHAEINDMLRRHCGRVPDRWIFNYAHAVVDARIDRSRYPRWYLARLVLHSTYAALRWNRSLSPALRKVLGGWSASLLGRAA
jgi:glycosyltransferase involved in cell wall biosynthesis